MDPVKRARLQAEGWQVGSVADFLHLTAEESAYIELRLKLAKGLRRQRQQRRLTQVQVARMLASSQSRVAKMEAGDPSVSLDLLIRSHLVLGSSHQDLAVLIGATTV